jgi:uncharacterized membrane protein
MTESSLDVHEPSARPGKDIAAQESSAISSAINDFTAWIASNWVVWIVLLTGAWVILPWFSPVFMKLGWEGPASTIYAIYSFQCHQLPQRSFFLFGPQSMYALEEIQSIWKDTADPVLLRQFIGSSEIGFKVAWSDRMVSAYSSIPIAGIIWWRLRRLVRPLPVWGLVLFLLPMAVDGLSHMISDFAGLGGGFRYSNAWLADLTGNSFPDSFYQGTVLGTFNSWMRLGTGALFGAGLVWFAFANFYRSLRRSAQLNQ